MREFRRNQGGVLVSNQTGKNSVTPDAYGSKLWQKLRKWTHPIDCVVAPRQPVFNFLSFRKLAELRGSFRGGSLITIPLYRGIV